MDLPRRLADARDRIVAEVRLLDRAAPGGDGAVERGGQSEDHRAHPRVSAAGDLVAFIDHAVAGDDSGSARSWGDAVREGNATLTRLAYRAQTP